MLRKCLQESIFFAVVNGIFSTVESISKTHIRGIKNNVLQSSQIFFLSKIYTIFVLKKQGEKNRRKHKYQDLNGPESEKYFFFIKGGLQTCKVHGFL